ncbi:MAG TPA: aminoglycoside phosphotransferase family protein [Mycobacteriales bacterium]|nr:aminoglycoside phosphotransferase family protein [Mycobacteriales bacterium]
MDPINAVLTPPDLEKFRALTGVGDAPLEVNFEGWSKLAILTDDRVFLFPRWGQDELLIHGAVVCEALAEVPYVPRVRQRWPEGTLSAGPFVAFDRRTGTPWIDREESASLAEFERMLRSLGQAIATWHRIDPTTLPAGVGKPGDFDEKPWLSAFLDPVRVEDAVSQAVDLTRADKSTASVWRRVVPALARMKPVLVHGDACENQLLVDEQDRVHTVLDWDTAGIGHPLHDFDFGEWGIPIFRWETEFGRLRRAMWGGYCAELGASPATVEEVHLLFTLAELAQVEERPAAGSWAQRRLAACRAAIGPATAAVVG